MNPFLVRTAVPPLATAEGRRVEGVERLYLAARDMLREWTERLGAEADKAGGWPEKSRLLTESWPKNIDGLG